MKPIPAFASLVFALVTAVHLHRVIFQWEVVINGTVMPMWTSVAGALITGILSLLLWMESRSASGPKN